MKTNSFSAYALTNEFDLNEIAEHFNITKRFRWEDYLILNNDKISNIITSPAPKSVYIYSFGSIVFINFSAAEMTIFIKYMENNFNQSKNSFSVRYIEEYKLEILPDSENLISNHITNFSEEKKENIDIISLVLARSVALERIEDSSSKALDEVEDIIKLLSKGKLNIKDEQLAKMASKILGFKYTSISYIMLLDKPDITWEDIDIDNFYYELIELFELKDRYEQVKHKLETLMDITEVFSTLTHARRSTRLEWMVIILILIEIFISFYEMFKGKVI